MKGLLSKIRDILITVKVLTPSDETIHLLGVVEKGGAGQDMVKIPYSSNSTSTGDYTFVDDKMSIDGDQVMSYNGTLLTLEKYVNSDHYGTLKTASGDVSLRSDSGGAISEFIGNSTSGTRVAAVDRNVVIEAERILGDSAVGHVTMPSLPTSDPNQAGALWSNSGVVTVSAGE